MERGRTEPRAQLESNRSARPAPHPGIDSASSRPSTFHSRRFCVPPRALPPPLFRLLFLVRPDFGCSSAMGRPFLAQLAIELRRAGVICNRRSTFGTRLAPGRAMPTRRSRKSNSVPAHRPAGISNHPVEEELESQAHVPPRGTKRGEAEPVLRPRPDEHPAPRDPAPKRRKPKYPMPE